MEYSEKMTLDVRCTECNKRLMKFLVIAQNNSSKKIRAKCPFCSGQSDILEIKGISYSGPIPEDDEFDKSSTPTSINDVQLIDNIFIFDIRKK